MYSNDSTILSVHESMIDIKMLAIKIKKWGQLFIKNETTSLQTNKRSLPKSRSKKLIRGCGSGSRVGIKCFFFEDRLNNFLCLRKSTLPFDFDQGLELNHFR